jgi:phospholipase/carboxylesterase
MRSVRHWLVAIALSVACRAPPDHVVAGVHIMDLGVGSGGGTLVVSLHGMGGAPIKHSYLWNGFSGADVVLPRGLLQSGAGYEWFDWPPGTNDDALADAIVAADQQLWPAIEELAHGRPIIVAGFSQGAMMAYAIAVLHPDRVVAALPIAGYLPVKLRPKPGAHVSPIYAFHGAADDTVDPQNARDTIAALKAAGATAELDELAGVGHEQAPFRSQLFERVHALLR